ncbi:GAF domain-containing protein [Galbitalea soli]|uniref:GAF domain-containing protein n=1 Tax=Galbitalea soli TaxID=1268042 RepID=A0A7C9PMK3_9MICO|nr:GAF domain-containing protein [Galbitalea soli]NYJ31507.1 GAF domain-containing protein [Galbitalea soli]
MGRLQHAIDLPPALRVWRWLFPGSWSSGPQAPERAVVHASGGAPLRILLLGGSIATGYGVATQDLAIAGHLARQLATRVGRGIDIDVVVERDSTIAGALALAATVDLRGYDAVILSTGVQDALDGASARWWVAQLAHLVARVRRDAALPVLVLEVPTPSRLMPLPLVSRLYADARARRLNQALRPVADAARGVHLVEMPIGPQLDPDRFHSPRTYAAWARPIVDGVAPILLALDIAGAGESAQPPRLAPRGPALHDERHRLRALSDTGVLDSDRDDRFDRIAAMAQRRFATSHASIAFIDGAGHRFKSTRGGGHGALPRGASLCDWTIRTDAALVVFDAALDERFAHAPLIIDGARLRAYAGYPIRSPGGLPIGTISVSDAAPRHFGESDIVFLRDLAHLVEKLLADRSEA